LTGLPATYSSRAPAVSVAREAGRREPIPPPLEPRRPAPVGAGDPPTVTVLTISRPVPVVPEDAGAACGLDAVVEVLAIGATSLSGCLC